MLLLLIAFALASSFAWLGGARFPDTSRGALLAATLAVCGTTAINLAIRWIRWHFLLRTFHIRMRARESLLVFVSLLPMILTPWAVGELLLALPLRKRVAQPLRSATFIWLASRGADSIAVLSIFFLTKWGLLPAALALFLLSTLGLAFVERRGSVLAQSFRIYLFVGVSVLAWAVAASGLALALLVLAGHTSWSGALEAFAKGTLAGSFTGAPAGIAITGSAMIRSLTSFGAAEPAAIWSVAALRWGTVGFAALLGLSIAIIRGSTLRAIIRGEHGISQGHFDELAPAYSEELPAHVRDRLIQTKSAILLKVMNRLHVPLAGRGLDIGCGQGWYLASLAQHGYAMTGCDLTAGQIEGARAYCGTAGIAADLQVASAEALPFADDSFDFAYTINVLHHITDPATFYAALREIVRVLKPGAPLIVFEMNTQNPLFRLYLSYLYPFIRDFDDGTETWLLPGRWPDVSGATWSENIEYITFLPDFLPAPFFHLFAGLEARLERSVFKQFSAHFAVALVKTPQA